MKSAISLLIVVALVCGGIRADPKCKHHKPDIPTAWVDMSPQCSEKVNEQIQTEMTTACNYLALASHFSRDDINCPHFAIFFFTMASQERQHAIKLIEYLLKRGELVSPPGDLISTNIIVNQTAVTSGADALRRALEMEASVTRKIRNLCEVCENPKNGANDYHIVDYLSGEFLDEQYEGQQKLAHLLSTLEKLKDVHHGPFAEFIFDKKHMMEANL